MKELFFSIINGIRRYFRQLVVLIGVLAVIVLIINGVYYFLSDNPKTCLVCHYMEPYYKLWEVSNHRDVTCIACHPDRRILLRKYSLRYLTSTYTSRPRAEVHDEACLSCHEGQTLDQSAPFERNIIFNHKEHLEKPQRGIQLHCTSCHNHRTPGHYLEVDDFVCFICHFKGAAHGQSKTGCQSCHGNPKQDVEHQGFMFNHQAYIDIGVGCDQCHIDVVKGNADVPQEACFSCHISRLEKFGDFPLVHDVHVRQHNIGCFRCHGSLQHGDFQLISSLEIRCESCHIRLHIPEKQLYMGAGGMGIPDEPSRMFSAQVSCDGCHVAGERIGEVEFGAIALKTRRESCVACHGKGYDLMLDDWLRQSKKLLGEFEPHLKSAESLLRAAERRGKSVATEKAAVEEARFNFDFVKDGHTVHNIFYAVNLLKHSAERLIEVNRKLDPSGPPMKLGRLLGTPDGFCTAMCHTWIPAPAILTFEKMTFPHSVHAQDLDLHCTDCHSPDKHKQRVISRQDCKSCHHQDYPIGCANCHWKQDELYRGESATLDLKDMPDVMAEAEVDCEGCHDLTKPFSRQAVGERCQECHEEGYAEMFSDWAAELDAAQAALDSELVAANQLLEEVRKVGRRPWDETRAIEEIGKRAEYLKEAGALHNYAATSEEYATLRKKLLEVQQRLAPAQ